MLDSIERTRLTYVDGAIKILQLKLSKRNVVLQKTAKEPFPTRLDESFNPKNPLHYSYRPELDVSPHLEQDDHTWYQQLLGILNWIVELGRIDVHNIVARLSAYLAAPRVGHIKAVLHVFAYLKATNNKLIESNKTLPTLPDDNIDGDKWKDFYPDADTINEKPPRMPRPLGNPVRIFLFCGCRPCRGPSNPAILYWHYFDDQQGFCKQHFQATEYSGSCNLWL